MIISGSPGPIKVVSLSHSDGELLHDNSLGKKLTQLSLNSEVYEYLVFAWYVTKPPTATKPIDY